MIDERTGPGRRVCKNGRMQADTCRHLILILGDQLDEDSSALQGADPVQDVILMVEAREESTHVWSHKIRTALFLSAMRHFAQTLGQLGWRVHYRALDEAKDQTLADGIAAAIARYQPARIIGVEPGEMRVRDAVDAVDAAIESIAHSARTAGAAASKPIMEWREDTHFLCSLPQFRHWAGQAPSLRMEFFYRNMRRQYKVLMDGEQPAGGQWNYDAENRKGFGRTGPKQVPRLPLFEPDSTTRDVIALVEREFGDHPGELGNFNWPVTREQALVALHDFIEHRLADFGVHQDAMWTHLDFGWHSLLSSSMNLKLLNPLEVILAAESAYRERARALDLASVEGFIRQILGWREFMRGVYYLDMPQLKEANHFGHTNALPKWYWTADTHMNCMRQCISQTLANGYSHHIQRLMVTGMFGVTAQIDPKQVCDWYLAVYVDAVEWVELPNTAGMALFAHGGRFTSKPYIAGGAYINRMSNYCGGCRYETQTREGPDACPMTTLYWNFVDRHESELAANPRTSMMVKNLQRFTADERLQLRLRAGEMLVNLDGL
jgi:deoxyribodipyrimidine photolyase-related protein